MKSIILLKGVSQYDAMRIYIDELQRSFQSQGYPTIIIDIQKSVNEVLEKLEQIIREKSVLAVFSCNGIMIEWFAEQNMFEKYNLLYATIFFDHPIYHSSRLEKAGSGMMIFFADVNHVIYAKRYHSLSHVKFVPVSGSKSQINIPYRQRKNTLIFTGSYFDLMKIQNNLQNLQEPYRKLAFDLIDILLETPEYTIEQAFSVLLRNMDFSASDEEFNLLLVILARVDTYVRGFYRDKILRTIVESGHKIHVYGNNWEAFSCNNTENLILNEGYGEKALNALANSKISINVMPWFRGGFQERIAAAMLNGAIALTDSSEYIDTHFLNNENIALYSLRQIEKIPFIIEQLIEDEKRSADIAENGCILAKKEHTWEDRGKQIISYIEGYNT